MMKYLEDIENAEHRYDKPKKQEQKGKNREKKKKKSSGKKKNKSIEINDEEKWYQIT